IQFRNAIFGAQKVRCGQFVLIDPEKPRVSVGDRDKLSLSTPKKRDFEMRCGQTVLIGCEKTWILRADADKLSSSGPQNARNIKSRSAPPRRIGFLAHWIGKGYPVLPSTCATIGSSRCGVAPVGASRPPPIPAAIADCPLPPSFSSF